MLSPRLPHSLRLMQPGMDERRGGEAWASLVEAGMDDGVVDVTHH